jgi:ElaB/YqjD/DUF883 family membrane-anchored ribosome-binding protein
MFARVFAAERGGTGSASDVSVSDNLVALRADLTGLAESVKQLAAESPGLALEGFESSIRRNPVQATLIAAGVGFVLALILAR